MNLFFFITAAVALQTRPTTSDTQCCSRTDFKSCRMACFKIFNGSHSSSQVDVLLQHCPKPQDVFWRCIHTSLVLKYKITKYPHGKCCSLAKTSICSVACYSIENRNNVLEFCGSNQNMAVARCINKVEVSEECCNIEPEDSTCKDACRELITSEDSPRTELAALREKCRRSPPFMHCIENIVGHDYSYCCNQAKNAKCKRKCRYAFSKRIPEEKLVRLLIEDCGYPFPQIGLYRCLFQLISDRAKSQQKMLPADARDSNILGNLCCSKARSVACKNWCKKILLKPSIIGPVDPMYVQCMENSFENDLSSCMEDVLEPCKFGCEDEMRFCATFNNRPLELYRRCNANADKIAEKMYKDWKNGLFLSHLSINLRIKNITVCHPVLWKALACSLVIKPCNQRTERSRICRSDCVFLLRNCMDTSEESQEKSVEEICMMLLPTAKQTGCTAISKYIVSTKKISEGKVQFPCRNNPCMADEMCIINRNCTSGLRSKDVRPYSCIPSCKVGTSASIHFRTTDLAKIPLDSTGECHQVCQCLPSEKTMNKRYSLSNCVDFGCNQRKSCQIGNMSKEHRNNFLIGCNFCTCFDGELLCTQRHCELSENKVFKCKCSNSFNPVCGFNGLTYQSICHARCAGLLDSQLKPGDCRSINPCLVLPCPFGFTCIQHSRVCLLSNFVCPQYDCVKVEQRKKTCLHADEALCSNQSSSDCIKRNNDKNHDDVTPVCGYDGVTYNHPFGAQNQLVPIDYYGPCQSKQGLQDRCKGIRCDNTDNCIGHIPVGGCCPVCEPLLRILFSRKEAAHHLKKVMFVPITVKDIVMKLAHHVDAQICNTNGFLSQEGDIMLIIRATKWRKKHNIEQEMCAKETEKIAGLINKRSPFMFTNYHVSLIKAVQVQYPNGIKSSSCVSTLSCSLHLLVIHVILLGLRFYSNEQIFYI